MSFYYKEIKVDNIDTVMKSIMTVYPPSEIKTKLFYPKGKLDFFFKIPELVDMLTNIGVLDFLTKDLGCSFVRINSKSMIPLHSDTKFRYSFNIPINDCSGSLLNFFSSSGPGRLTETSNGVTYTSYDEKNCSLLLSTKITSPFIMDATVPHQVINNSDSDSILLLVRLNHDIDSLIDKYF